MDASANISTPLITVAVALMGVVVSIVVAIYKFGRWQGKVETELRTFRSFMKEIRDNVKEVFERLPQRTVTANSPLRLTTFGEKIAKTFGTQEWAKGVALSVATNLVNKEPFEIDDFCQGYVDDMLDQDEATRVGNCAYTYGIESKDVLQVLRVVLRNEILSRLEHQYRCLETDEDKTWHFWKKCPYWPKENFEVSLTEPTVGTYCGSCKILRDKDDIPF